MSKEFEEGFKDFLDGIDDPRINRKKLYSLSELFFLTLAALICGADGWNDIESFGREKLDYLRQFLPYTNGIPSDDTLRRFFRRLNPDAFKTCFAKWMENLGQAKDRLISIDGKVSRHSFDGDQSPLHLVTAFASEARLVLAQQKVADKSNEITAIPELLKLLDIKGSTVTIDAMGCQRAIAEQIQLAQADYVLSLKGNQGTLHDDVMLLFQDEERVQTLAKEQKYTQVEKGHGRIETRSCTVMDMPNELKKLHNWPGLQTVVEIESTREIKAKKTQEKRYYISSVSVGAKEMLGCVRSHWAIENSLHYVLDIAFKDDASRIRQGNGPLNLGIVKHMALNLLRQAQRPRESIQRLRKMAGWNNEKLSEILAF